MENTNQTDNEKNGEDKMESTCDKDDGVTEKSEEEMSFPPPIPCKAKKLSFIDAFFLAIGLNLFLRVIIFLFLLFVFPVATHSEGCERHVGRHATVIINPVTNSSKATLHASVRGEWFP